MNILDLDLDFFLNDIKNDRSTFSTERLSSSDYKAWDSKNVIQFLEYNCGLKKKIINGKYFIHHNEFFFFLKDILKNGEMVYLDHVDAHADLGLRLGDFSTEEFISTELLKHPIQERQNYIKRTESEKDLSPGNFLIYAIACGWIKQFNYIHPPNKGTDIGWFIMKEFHTKDDGIQLKNLTKKEFNFVLDSLDSDTQEFIKNFNPNNLEKEVPIKRISSEHFISKTNYDYILLTQSPGFTPKESDKLIPIILDYINLEWDHIIKT